MMIGMTILGAVVAVLAVGSMLTILVASIIAVRRQPCWHSRCRVTGVSIHCGSLLAIAGLVVAGSGSDSLNNILPVVAVFGLAGTATFAVGYLGQVLESGKMGNTEPHGGG